MADIFWRAWCRRTKRELKFRTHNLDVANFEEMQDWVFRFYRDLDLKEWAPWDDAMHGGGVFYPVPVQNVKFDPPVFELPNPGRRRTSISAAIPRKRLLITP